MVIFWFRYFSYGILDLYEFIDLMLHMLEQLFFKKTKKEKIVNKNEFQPFPFGGGFESKKVNKEGERTQLTPERKEQLDKMILEVVKLFEESNITWSIDGGLSISLFKGEYMGEHRDLDIAVEVSQLE